jgi:hypothetical protein
MTEAELGNALLILRRVRQSSCGFCWANPGRRCWRMTWQRDRWLSSGRIMMGVHASRVFRAQAKGVIGFDMDPRSVRRAAWWEETRGLPLPEVSGRMSA